METDPRITALVEAKAELVAYLLMKVRAADWHAVQDAASDIREIDAKLEVLKPRAPLTQADRNELIDQARECVFDGEGPVNAEECAKLLDMVEALRA